MFSSILITLALVASSSRVVAADAPGGVLAGAPVSDVQVSTDGVVQCGTATISWIGTTSPVQLQIGVGGYYVGTTWLTSLSNLYDSSTTWTVDQPSGSDLIFQVTDANGQVGYVQNVQVQDSSDSSCLAASASASASASTTWSDDGGYSAAAATSAPAATSAATTTTAWSSSLSKKSKSRSSRSSTYSTASTSTPRAASPASASPSSSVGSTTDVSPAVLATAISSTFAVSTSSSTSASAAVGSATLAAANAGQTGGAGRAMSGNGVVVGLLAGMVGLMGCVSHVALW